MNFTDIISIITGIGAVSGIVLFYLNKKMSNQTAVASILKTNKEVEQIEQEIESKYANQVKDWLEDLEEIKSRHDIALSEKDAALTKLHHDYLMAIKDMSEQRLRLDRFGKATRRILVNMDVPYWECDKEGAITYTNGAWLKLFGLKPEEASGSKWIVAIPEEERHTLLVEWGSRIADQAEDYIEFNIQNPLTNEVTRVKSLYAIIFDSDDNIFKIIGVTVVIPKYVLQNK